MHYGGSFGGPLYVGGSYRFIDYCHEDEISIIELTTMATEMGQHYSNDYYVRVNGENILLKSDLEVMQLPKLVDCNGVVHVYICNLEDVIPTQGSQIGNGSAKTKTKPKSILNPNLIPNPIPKSILNPNSIPKPIPKPIQNSKPIPKPIMKPKPFVKPRVSVKPNPTAKGKGVVQDEEDTDTDEYDPDSSSSSEDDEDFCESDYEVEDDDAMFDKNVDAGVEFSGLEDHSLPHDYEYALAVEGLTNVDGDSDVVSCDELRSPCNSDDEEGLGAQSKHTIFNENTDMINPVFEPNMEFKTHALVRDAVKEYSIKWGLQTRFLKCDREKVRVKCKEGCPWELYASYVKADGVYRIKTLIDEHTCTRTYHVPWVSTNWIVNKYCERIKRNPTWPVSSLHDEIQAEWTVSLDIQKVRRAKKKALEMLEGTATQQFALLSGYIEEIRSTNPGTTIKLKVKPVNGRENEVKFKRLYICWGALKKGFHEGCRPVIGLDGCHLKGPHGGILLTAVGIDANNCIYPFAYAVVEKEKKKTWLWFLELLSDDLNVQNSYRYTFMTDKQKGLIDAVGQVFPNASHRFCVRHLYNNFKGDFKGLHLKEILWKAARASTVAAFTKAMEEMKTADPKALAWLIERPPVNWSRSHFDTFPKCDILLNNLCESFNAAILSARDKPIITMLKRIRIILIQTTQKRLEAMKRCKDPICPKIKKRLDLLRGEKGWIARYCGNKNFEIVGPHEQYKVNLENKTCGCRKWELSGIPCVHAVCGYNHLYMDPMDYVHDCYKVTTYLSCYGNGLGPINGREMWPTTDHPVILPPDVKKRAGRPKKARRREPEEQEPVDPTRVGRKGVKMTCGKCGQVGHNRRSCKGDPSAPTEQAPNAATQQGSTSQMVSHMQVL